MDAAVFETQARVEEDHWWFVGRRRILEGLLAALVPPGARVVDVGCGTGGNAAALARTWSVVGLEPSADAVRIARDRYPDVTVVRGVVEGEGGECLRGARAVLLTDVLEHVADDVRLLSSVLSRLPAGAHVLLTVPAHPELWSEHDVTLAHYRRYDVDRLEATWRGLPVTPRLVSPFNARLFPVARVVRSIHRLLGRTHGEGGTDLSTPPAPLNRLLTRIFAGELTRLRAAVDTGRPAFPDGLSLLAVLRREEGHLEPRDRPPELGPDLHDPGSPGEGGGGARPGNPGGARGTRDPRRAGGDLGGRS